MKPFFRICVFLFFLLASCDRQARLPPSPTAAPLTFTSPAQLTRANTPTTISTSTLTASPGPNAIPTRAATNTRIPTITHTYTPTQPQTPTNTPTATSAPALEPPGLLDRKDPMSLVRWLRYGLINQDLSYIEPLLAEQIRYSLAYTDYPGVSITKETFVWRLQQRLSNHPSCVQYTIRSGEIKYLEISTEGWNPLWPSPGVGDASEFLVLAFSDQWTPEEGLYLFGAYVSRLAGKIDPDAISCR